MASIFRAFLNILPVWDVVTTVIGPIFIFFCLRIFPFRFPKQYRLPVLLAAGIVCGMAIYWTDQLFYALGIELFQYKYIRISLFSTVFIILFAWMLYHGDGMLVALTSLLLYNIFSAARFAFLGLLLCFFPQLGLRLGVAICAVPTSILCFAVYLFISRVQQRAVSGLSPIESVLWFIVALTAMLITCVQSDLVEAGWPLTLTALSLIFTSAVIYSLIFMYSRQKFIAAEQQKILSNIDKYEGYLEQMRELDTHISILRHEEKNHIFYIDQLLTSGNYAALRAYVDERKAEDLGAAAVVTTGNSVLDLIVNQKCAYARSLGIGIQVSTALQEEIHIDELSLCSVLGNLLNNAIEGSANTENPHIHLDIRTFKGYFVVTAKNLVSTNVIKENPHLLTTKKDAENHGFGIKAIEQVADRYEGSLRLEMADKRTFCASVMMKNIPPSKSGEH